MTLDKLIEMVSDNGAWKGTKFISEKEIVRVTRILYGRRIRSRGNHEFVVTFGKPNYEEREYIKLLKAAEEPFPVRKIWLRYPPKRK